MYWPDYMYVKENYSGKESFLKVDTMLNQVSDA